MNEELSRSEGSGVDREVAQTRLKEYALLAPRLVRLVFRLTRDPRVSPRIKAALLVVGGYLASPVDLLPDFIPGLGQLDDLILAAFALDRMVNRVPEHIVREHWSGDEDVLDVVRNVLDISTAFIPNWMKKLFSDA